MYDSVHIWNFYYKGIRRYFYGYDAKYIYSQLKEFFQGLLNVRSRRPISGSLC